MVEPRKALDQAGAETRIVSPRDKHVRAWNLTNWKQVRANSVVPLLAAPCKSTSKAAAISWIGIGQ
jgi:hypothetical protein